MHKTFAFAKKLFPATIRFSMLKKNWVKLFASTFFFTGYYHYQKYYSPLNASCSFFRSSRFNFQTASKSTVVIYSNETGHPIGGGLIIDEEGLCITVGNMFPRISEDRIDLEPVHAKVLGEENVYSLKYVDYIADENLVLFKLIKRDYEGNFTPVKFSSSVNIGDQAFVIGKSPSNFNIIESGLVNETDLNAKLVFGKDFDTSTFNVMVNIPNNTPSLYGSPLFNQEGQVFGMIIPFEERLSPKHILAMPACFLEGIISQYKATGKIRRPYLGLSIKSSSSGNGAFIIRVGSDSPAFHAGVKLGDTIVEVNDRKITNNNDFFKCLGYKIGEPLKLKLERDGKYRTVIVNPQ